MRDDHHYNEEKKNDVQRVGRPRRRLCGQSREPEVGITTIPSEFDYQEICERYLSESRARAEEVKKKAEGGGAHSTKPAESANDEEHARPRRRPGV